jgi:hypothetical protein
MTQIEKHEKAIRILEAISSLQNRILSHERAVKMSVKNSFGNIWEHYTERLKIDNDIKKRLQNYYEKSFKI